MNKEVAAFALPLIALTLLSSSSNAANISNPGSSCASAFANEAASFERDRVGIRNVNSTSGRITCPIMRQNGNGRVGFRITGTNSPGRTTIGRLSLVDDAGNEVDFREWSSSDAVYLVFLSFQLEGGDFFTQATNSVSLPSNRGGTYIGTLAIEPINE